jgi:cytidine deaminase
LSDPGIDPSSVDDLIRRAWDARERAYAPYSRFLVGAAILVGDGTVFTGSNVENASYSVAICAERVAGAAAVASGATDLRAVAVTSSAVGPAPPCGVCRQFLFEFNPDMVIVSEGRNGERAQWRLRELLVDGFGPANLEDTT